MSAGLRAETGSNGWDFIGGVLYVFFGLFFGLLAIDSAGITIPLSDSPSVRLLQILLFGSAGCAALHAVAFVAYFFLKKIGLVLYDLLEAGESAGRRVGEALADLAVAGLIGLARLAVMPITWPWNRFRSLVITPWLERRRQEEELRSTYEAIKGRFGSYEEFLRAFNGEADAREEQSEPPPEPVDEFAAACELLGLSADGSFTQAAFKTRYRQLMKEAHPDVSGSEAQAVELNKARDLIKSRKGWK